MPVPGANLEPEIEYFVDEPHEESSPHRKVLLVSLALYVDQTGPGGQPCT